ncbi:MAG TPA: flavodoxin family protein [Methanocorpusculum sp.]|nr:flavodoxin family protein [Methanocorpusculum sp.]
MRKILGICGSSAPKSSTKKLIEIALETAKISGAEVEFIDAAKMSIHGCKGCLACKKDQTKFCVQKDDMTPLYEKINEADAVIIGSPIYFGDITGQIKCFIDRMYAFLGPNGSKIAAGKKVVAVITHGVPDVKTYANCANILTSGFQYCGAVIEKPLIVGNLHSADELDEDAIIAAKEIGKTLAA